MNNGDKLSKGRREWLPFVILYTGLFLTLVVTISVAQNIRLASTQEFEHATTRFQADIEERTEAYLALLRGIAGLYAVKRWITDDEFAAYVKRLRVSRFYAGLRGIGFACRVTPENKNEFFSRLEDQGMDDFKIWPDPRGAESFPSVYLEPLEQNNRASIGYDLFSEPVRRKALEEACDSGEPAISGKLVLVGTDTTALHIYVPLYKSGEVPETVEDRRRTLDGFGFARIDIAQFLEQRLRGIRFPLHLEIYDGEAIATGDLLFRTAGFLEQCEKGFSDLKMNMAGRPWTLRICQPSLSHTRGFQFLLLIPIGGTALSLFLYYLTRSENTVRRNAQRAVRDLQESRAALQQSEERLRLVMDSIKEYAIFTLDKKGRIASWNPGAERMFNYTEEEVLGRDPAILFTPEDIQRGELDEELRAAVEHHQSFLECCHVRKDGSCFWASDYIASLHDSAGNLRGFAKIVRDMTEQKRAEEQIQNLNRELEDRVHKRTAALQESYAQMETFSYTVAHDLRAPLRAMQGFCQALEEDYGPHLDELARDYISRIVNASTRMDALINDLLDYSQMARVDLKFEKIDLGKVVDHVLDFFSVETKNRNAVIIVQRPFPCVSGHQTTVETVIANLVGNALKFVAANTTPRVHIWAERRNEGPKPMVRLWIEDNGIGIAPEHRERIFRVFERLHGTDVFCGTGIGLALVKKGVERMGGRVGLESTVGQGSQFWIELPVPKEN